MYSSFSELIKAPKNMMDYVKLVEAHVKVRIISEIKKYIDCGAIEQEKLSNISNRELIIEVLQKLICDVWDELGINISNIMLEKNLLMAMEIYNYLTPDFKLLSMNYSISRSDIGLAPSMKKNYLLNTIEILKKKIKYIDDDVYKDNFINAINGFEYKVNNYEDSKQLTAFFIAMKNANIHILMNIDTNGEKLIYPEILDLFKDYHYLEYVFNLDKERIGRLSESLENNHTQLLSPADHDLLIQLDIADRSQVPPYIRKAYEEKPLYEFKTLKTLLRQMFKDNVSGQRRYAVYPFNDVTSFPLPLYKYTLLCTE